MSWLSNWLNPGRGYQKGQEQLNDYYGQTQARYNQGQGYLDPLRQQGQAQYGNMQQYIQNLMNPQALEDKWSKGYKESDAAKGLEGLANEHGLNAASSLGLMGSAPALQAIQAGTTGIAAQDRQNYMKDLMDKYMQGAGLTQGLYNTGAQAAGQMGVNAMGSGQNAMNMGQNSANMAYGQQNAGGDLFSKLLGGAAGLFGGYLGNQNFGQKSPWNTGGR